MQTPTTKRLLLAWLGLCTITLGAWFLSTEGAPADTSSSDMLTYTGLAIATVKVRIIVVEFMEAWRQSKRLQRVFDVWLLLLMAGLALVYALGLDMPTV